MGIGPTYSRDDAGAVPAAGDDSSPDALQTLEKRRDQNRQDLEELADSIGLSTSPTWRRLKALQDAGLILEYVARLDAALAHYAKVLDASALAASPGAGAAGGIGFGALLVGARFRPGIEVMLDVLGFASALERADLVITGEGSLDEQTLHGKAPAGVAAAARAAGKDVVAVCGRLALPPEVLGRAGIRRAYALTDLEPDVAVCIAEAGALLERTGERIARDYLT